MKSLLLAFLIMASFCVAQTIDIQAEHDQYLIDSQKTHFLQVEPELITFEGCSKEGYAEISLRILENKFSALVRIQEKKIYQEGVLSLEKQPELLVFTKFDDKEIKFVLNFSVAPTQSQIKVEGNYAEILPQKPADVILLGVSSHIYPIFKQNIGTDHYKPCIMSFIYAERPLFFLISAGTLFQDERSNCPHCGYPLYQQVNYCNSCNNCFSASLSKCNRCWSTNFSSGKICSQCQRCYR